MGRMLSRQHLNRSVDLQLRRITKRGYEPISLRQTMADLEEPIPFGSGLISPSMQKVSPRKIAGSIYGEKDQKIIDHLTQRSDQIESLDQGKASSAYTLTNNHQKKERALKFTYERPIT